MTPRWPRSAWAECYESLRQVTTADIVEQLDKHHGTGRRMATTAIRSLFRILKEQRMIFADPAVRITCGHYSPPPILPVDPPTRAGLLDRDGSPLFGLVILLAGVHALRTKEIAAITLDSVDLQRGTLVAKGSSTYSVALNGGSIIQLANGGSGNTQTLSGTMTVSLGVTAFAQSGPMTIASRTSVARLR